jgi:hypothetical protein
MKTRMNAVRHGALSETPVLPLVEREEDWQEHRQRIFDALRPRDGLEENLVERVAVLFWRLRRVIRYEREATIASQLKVGEDYVLGRRLVGITTPVDKSDPRVEDEIDQMLLNRLLPGEDTVNKITRYEIRLHRLLLQTLNQLYLIRRLAPRVTSDEDRGAGAGTALVATQQESCQ